MYVSPEKVATLLQLDIYRYYNKLFIIETVVKKKYLFIFFLFSVNIESLAYLYIGCWG